MKTIIVTLVIFSTLIACQEENPQPVAPDPFIGSWRLVNSATPEIELSFDIDEDLTVHNVQFKHPDVPSPEVLEYSTDFFYRHAVNAACKRIKIQGESDQVTAIVTMFHNRIHLQDPNELKVWEMEIDVKGKPLTILNSQVFARAN